MSFVESLHARARVLDRKIVFPEGEDPRVLAAVATLVAERLVRPVVLGPLDEVRASLRQAGVDPSLVLVVDPPERDTQDRPKDVLVAAALMVHGGEADGAVAGAVRATPDVVRAGLSHIGLPDGMNTVSSSFYMVVPPFRGSEQEVLTFADAGVVPEPDERQLAEIAAAAADARRAIVGDEPVVAFLSYSTLGSAAGDSVQRMVRARDLFRKLRPDVPADGELQGDAALIEAVAARKAPGSPAAGKANVLIFPDLNSGNIAYKLVQRLAGADAFGPIIQGLRLPFNDLSRGSEPSDIVNVACITALMSAKSP
ncbi:MAG: phosphate acetyltransferase [Gemmatimonadota bacterium]|nr:MAG: phosphate acetyltransferase [Gemmatimonadota bacterium]